MKGYKEGSVPTNLKAYFTFEETEGMKFKNLGTGGREYDGSVVVISGSGGESTSSAAYVDQKPNTDVLGFPGIEGSFDIKTKPTWMLGDGQISSQADKTAVVTYAAPGKKNVTLKLKNGWGETEKTVEEIVEITSGVNSISELDAQSGFSVYPNPFVESVNMRFADYGRYTINILDATGVLLQSNIFDATQGQVVNVAISGAKGMYLVQVLKEGKIYKTVKVVKK